MEYDIKGINTFVNEFSVSKIAFIIIVNFPKIFSQFTKFVLFTCASNRQRPRFLRKLLPCGLSIKASLKELYD